jgi:nicotinamidase-related amidase
MVIKFISVDLQHDFSAKGGSHYKVRPSVQFIKDTLLPFLQKKKMKVSEIISDYRREYNRKDNDACIPGTWGYISELPAKNENENIWIKCQNSPIWVTKNIGNPKKKPSAPYQDPKAFTRWLNSTIGKPEDIDLVVLIGLTLDCCVLCTAQELKFRRYKVRILKEATDTYSGTKTEKEMILKNYPLINWAKPIAWKELRKFLK